MQDVEKIIFQKKKSVNKSGKRKPWLIQGAADILSKGRSDLVISGRWFAGSCPQRSMKVFFGIAAMGRDEPGLEKLSTSGKYPPLHCHMT